MSKNDAVRNIDVLTSKDQGAIRDIMYHYREENQPEKLACILGDMYDLIENIIIN